MEQPRFESEPNYEQHIIDNFEEYILWPIVEQRSDDEDDRKYLPIFGNGNIHDKQEGEKNVEFSSFYDDNLEVRNYIFSITQTESEDMDDLPPEVRQVALEEARQASLDGYYDEDDEIDIVDDNLEGVDGAFMTLEYGQNYEIVDGSATKQSFVHRYVNGILVDEVYGGGPYSKDPAQYSDDAETIDFFVDANQDLSKVTEGDFDMLQDIMQRIGLTTEERVDQFKQSIR